MPDISTLPVDDTGGDDNQQKLQGYQDDFDTSQRDQFANDAGSDPSEDVAATKAEFRQGLRDTTAPSQEGGQTTTDQANTEPPLASEDDYREQIEGLDQDSADVGGDDKSRSLDSWQ